MVVQPADQHPAHEWKLVNIANETFSITPKQSSLHLVLWYVCVHIA